MSVMKYCYATYGRTRPSFKYLFNGEERGGGGGNRVYLPLDIYWDITDWPNRFYIKLI